MLMISNCIKLGPHVHFMMFQLIKLYRQYYVVLRIALNLAIMEFVRIMHFILWML